MKRPILITLIIVFSSILFMADTMDDTGRAGYVGSPGEVTCNTTNCHNSFALNSGPGSVSAKCNMINWTYEPLTTYTINVKVAKPAGTLFGFAAEILTYSNTNAGTILVTDNVHTQIKTRSVGGVTRRNIVHKLNGGASPDSAVFTFNWTSPDTSVGTITMYFAGNAANGNGNSNGDYIYTSSQVITPSSGTGVAGLKMSDPFSVYPNPVIDKFSLHYFLRENAEVVVRLYDLSGRHSFTLIDSSKPAGENNDEVLIPSGCTPGLYVLSVETPSGKICRKVMVN